MKKLTLILLLAVYTASVVGISINRFYCCGRLQSTSISPLAFTKPNAKNDGCCQHKQTVFKVKDSHEVTGIAHIVKAGWACVHAYFNSKQVNIAYLFAPLPHGNAINAPPLLLHCAIYTKVCSYRI